MKRNIIDKSHRYDLNVRLIQTKSKSSKQQHVRMDKVFNTASLVFNIPPALHTLPHWRIVAEFVTTFRLTVLPDPEYQYFE